MVVADLGAGLVFEAPEGPAQGVAPVVVDGQDGVREQVADVGDGGVQEQVRAQPVDTWRPSRWWAGAFPGLACGWSAAGVSVAASVSWGRWACWTARNAWANMHAVMVWCHAVQVRTWA